MELLKKDILEKISKIITTKKIRYNNKYKILYQEYTNLTT